MKKIALAVAVVLSACATVPPIADTAIAMKLATVISVDHRDACVVTSYHQEGHYTEGGMINLRDSDERRKNGTPPEQFTNYVVECDHRVAYLVQIPDNNAIKPWLMKCDSHWQAFHGHCLHITHN